MTRADLIAANEQAYADLRKALKEGQPREIIEDLKRRAHESDRKVDAL